MAENRMLERRGHKDHSAVKDEKKHKERTGYDKKKKNMGKKK